MTAVLPEQSTPLPQPKPTPIVKVASSDAVASPSASQSRASSKARSVKSRQSASAADVTSKAATLALIRRTLITDSLQGSDPRSSPNLIDGILPPLTSSNDIDLQLYAVVAIIVKDFVNTWYSKITQDHIFVEEIVSIIAHCSRAIEERIRHTDVAELILDDLALLLERHVIAYRTANSSLAQQAYGVHPRVTYHSLNPHPALEPIPSTEDTPVGSPEELQNEAVYRQLLVNAALAVLLPTEDVQNAPLRVLVGDIIADLILGQAVAEKVCEGWFLHDAITKGIAATMQRLKPKATGQELHHEATTKLEHFGLLNTKNREQSSYPPFDNSNIALWFWRIAQWLYLAVTAVWVVLQGLFNARHLPKRHRALSLQSGSLKSPSNLPIDHEYDLSPRPVLAYHISNFISTLVRLREHMPWLESTFMFWQNVLLAGIGQLGCPNSVLDRFLHDVLTTYIFTPNLIVNVLVGLRIGVFPTNSLGPPAPPPPSLQEQHEIRRRAAQAISDLLPNFVVQRYFDTVDEDDILQHIEEDLLDVLSDKYMNKHLIYGIIELILVTLLPELKEAGVVELLAERGVSWAGADVGAGSEKKVPIASGKDTG